MLQRWCVERLAKYPARPENVLPDEPGWLPADRQRLRIARLLGLVEGQNKAPTPSHRGQDLVRAEQVTMWVSGRRVVIPTSRAVVCTSSPSTAWSICCGAVCVQLHTQPTTRQPAPY